MITSCPRGYSCFLLIAFLCAVFTLPTRASSAPAQQKRISLDADPHLVAWWKFDETLGQEAFDSSEHGHRAVLGRGLSFDTHSVEGHIGKSLEFAGDENCLRVPGFKGVTGTKPRTITAWIKTTHDDGRIVSWGLDDAGKMWIFGFIRSRIGVSPHGGYLYMQEEIGDGEWHHVAAVVREGSPPNLHDHVTLYKDGELAQIHDIGLLDLWPIDTGDALDLRIGDEFEGAIDDLRIYDRALSDEEIEALFNLQSDRL